MKKKLIFATILSLTLLTACGDNDKTQNDTGSVKQDMENMGDDMADTAKDAVDGVNDAAKNMMGTNDANTNNTTTSK